MSRPSRAIGVPAAALAFLLTAMGAREAAPAGAGDAPYSPLFARRLELGIGAMDRGEEPVYQAALQIYDRSVETVLSLNPVSFCAGSACLGSFCGGSACLLSKCAGSACANSTCVGSGCAVSACMGSACGASLCVGSGCLGSACVGSACLTCPMNEAPPECLRG